MADLHYSPKVCQMGKDCWIASSIYIIYCRGSLQMLYPVPGKDTSELTQRTLRKPVDKTRHTQKKHIKKTRKSSIGTYLEVLDEHIVHLKFLPMERNEEGSVFVR